jgi:hypothetical protein
LVGEVAGSTGNTSRGSEGGGSGRRWRPAARSGSGSSARSREREKAEEKRENGSRASLPHGGASAAACGGEEAAEWRRDGRPKLGNDSGGGEALGA